LSAGATLTFKKLLEADGGYGEPGRRQVSVVRSWAITRKRSSGFPESGLVSGRRRKSYFNIGLANYYLKQYREAEQAYRQAIKLDPYNGADTYYALGINYRDWGQFDEEIQAYKHAIRLKPDYTAATSRLGQRYLQQKKYAEAGRYFQANVRPKTRRR